MSTIERQMVIDALDNAGADPDRALRESYSGRAMYGTTCFGITGSIHEYSAFLVELTRLDDEEQYASELAMSVRTDDMGRETIFYFPGIELED